MPKAQPAPPIDDAFPVPLQEFLKRMVGTSDEVWITLMRQSFTGMNLKMSEWTKKLESLKG